jgi:hypothetical protein
MTSIVPERLTATLNVLNQIDQACRQDNLEVVGPAELRRVINGKRTRLTQGDHVIEFDTLTAAADHLGIKKATASAYINGRINPKKVKLEYIQ